MAMTKVEAAKLTQDMMLRGVIETIITESMILELVPSMQLRRETTSSRLQLRGLDERQHPGAADRGRAEPEALVSRDGLVAASCAVWEPFGPSGAAKPVLTCLPVITDQASDRGAGALNPGGP